MNDSAPSTTSSARFALVLTTIAAASLVGSALLAPALATGLQSLLDAPDLPFSRIFDRLAIIILLGTAVVFRKDLGLGRIGKFWRAESWSLRARMTALGITASLAPALVFLGPAIESSRLLWSGSTAFQGALKILEGLPSAVLVGLVEECFFRVVVFRGLSATWRWPLAAAGASVFYSVVHFLTPEKGYVIEGASPVEGLRYLGASFARVADPIIFPAVVGLFLIGLVLCTTIQRKGSLGLAIGLHAGWFLAAKAAVRLTSLPPELAAGESLIKRQLLIGSPWLWVAIATTAAIVVIATRNQTVRRDTES